MKTLTVAAALLALLALPAQAQMGGRRQIATKRRPIRKSRKLMKKPTRTRSSAFPSSKEKYDPWSGARPSTDQKQSR